MSDGKTSQIKSIETKINKIKNDTQALRVYQEKLKSKTFNVKVDDLNNVADEVLSHLFEAESFKVKILPELFLFLELFFKSLIFDSI
ncbi:MAG: hypothetical protein KDD45_13435 [Bdellovibrionales bacterium]|nr:hypothetical protein [Bdellovibrionales bacterium]